MHQLSLRWVVETCGADFVSQTELIDIRDNKLYWVAKLQDDHCWMTQNLDLNLDSNTPLTSENTDLNEFGAHNYDTANGYSCSNSDPSCSGGIISFTPERSTIDAVTDEETSLDSISGWVNDANNPYSIDSGDWYWYGQWYDSGNCPAHSDTNPISISCDYLSKRTKDKNGTDVINNWSTYFSTVTFSADGTHGHVGNYYNWPSSVASNNASVYTSGITSASDGPQNSICPAGWRLSSANTSETTSEFGILNIKYNSGSTRTDASLLSVPLYFVRAGGTWSYDLHYAGYYGYYWYGTVVSDTMARGLNFASNGYNSYRADARFDGRSLRCLAHTDEPKTINDLEYLQDFATLQAYDKTSVLNSMSYDTTYSLKDSRDNQTYQIAKLKDNKIWMENLNLGDTDNHPLVVSQLDHTNTNLPNEPGYEISATTFSSTTEGSWKKTSGSATYTSPEYISVDGYDATADTPYGTLYNYCAASANTYCAPAGESSGNAQYNLCPAG